MMLAYNLLPLKICDYFKNSYLKQFTVSAVLNTQLETRVLV